LESVALLKAVVHQYRDRQGTADPMILGERGRFLTGAVLNTSQTGARIPGGWSENPFSHQSDYLRLP